MPRTPGTPPPISRPRRAIWLNIRVIGEQYAWSFFYPEVEGEERVYAYNDMYVPGMTVTLDVQSKDVAHSWWIPELGGKLDALPGYTNKTWFRIPLDAIPRVTTAWSTRASAPSCAGATTPTASRAWDRAALRRLAGLARSARRRISRPPRKRRRRGEERESGEESR